MNKELEKKLVAKYPKILKDYGGDINSTCMHWGFECGDGWYKLLDNGMEKLQYFCDVCTSDYEVPQVIAAQIKEKFGTLCFYVDYKDTNDIQKSILLDIISHMHRESKTICEITGDFGSLCRKGMWYKTLSYSEARKRGYEPVEQGVREY